MPRRQEVVNVVLAQALWERRLVTEPEQNLRVLAERARQMPDVIVDLLGLRLAIEAEYGLNAGAEDRAYQKARQRVEDGIAHVGIAVLYPAKLRDVGFSRLKEELAGATLRFSVLAEGTVHVGFPLPLFPGERPGFVEGGLDDLADALRQCYEQLVRDEVLMRAAEILGGSTERLTGAFQGQPGSVGRFGEVLGLGRFATAGERRPMARIAALVVANAMIFQEILAQRDSRVRSLDQFRGLGQLFWALADQWRFILREINYHPIFHVAQGVLGCLASSQDVDRALERLMRTASDIVAWRAPLRHDLAGRIYHRLLAEAKYLGAYYTSIPAAVMLSRFALRPDAWAVDWGDQTALAGFRLADLACGTGTLLMAATDAVADNYVRARVGEGNGPDLDALQSVLLEKAVYGFDVLDSAVHLTASTLALRVPEVPVNVTNLCSVPLGGEGGETGKPGVRIRFDGGGDALRPAPGGGGGARGAETVWGAPAASGPLRDEPAVHPQRRGESTVR